MSVSRDKLYTYKVFWTVEVIKEKEEEVEK